MMEVQVNPDFFTVDQVAQKLQLSRPSVYALFKTGMLKPIKFGTSTRVSAKQLAKLQ